MVGKVRRIHFEVSRKDAKARRKPRSLDPDSTPTLCASAPQAKRARAFRRRAPREIRFFPTTIRAPVSETPTALNLARFGTDPLRPRPRASSRAGILYFRLNAYPFLGAANSRSSSGIA